MSNRRLGKCPTCFRPLDDATRAGMGLRNGEILNAMCPGLIGPSDIDHVLHNDGAIPERVMFFEYKNQAALTGGQRRLFRGLSGEWKERNTGRLLTIRFAVLDQHTDNVKERLQAAVDWIWPKRPDGL